MIFKAMQPVTLLVATFSGVQGRSFKDNEKKSPKKQLLLSCRLSCMGLQCIAFGLAQFRVVCKKKKKNPVRRH